MRKRSTGQVWNSFLSLLTPSGHHEMTNYWIGGVNGDWFAAANWSEGVAPPNKGWVDVLAGKPDGSAVTINVAQANATQITTLKVGSNATLNVTATSTTPSATAFYANSLTVVQGGTMIFDTPSTINLGSNPTINGTLQISGNPSVSINSHSVGGTGMLILDHTTLGSTNAQFQMGSSLTTVLQNGASLYVNNATAGGRIVFGRDAVDGSPNQLLLADYNQTVSTPITGYDAASVITIGHGGSPPISATFVANSNGAVHAPEQNTPSRSPHPGTNHGENQQHDNEQNCCTRTSGQRSLMEVGHQIRFKQSMKPVGQNDRPDPCQQSGQFGRKTTRQPPKGRKRHDAQSDEVETGQIRRRDMGKVWQGRHVTAASSNENGPPCRDVFHQRATRPPGGCAHRSPPKPIRPRRPALSRFSPAAQ